MCGGKWKVLSTKANSGNCTICLLAVKRPKNSITGINAAVQHLNHNGILVSETSACASKVNPEILRYYNINPLEEDLVRVSWGCYTEENDINQLILRLNEL